LQCCCNGDTLHTWLVLPQHWSIFTDNLSSKWHNPNVMAKAGWNLRINKAIVTRLEHEQVRLFLFIIYSYLFIISSAPPALQPCTKANDTCEQYCCPMEQRYEYSMQQMDKNRQTMPMEFQVNIIIHNTLIITIAGTCKCKCSWCRVQVSKEWQWRQTRNRTPTKVDKWFWFVIK
jgi:hypothetical protein